CIASYTLVDDKGIEHAAALGYFEAIFAITAPIYALAVLTTRGSAALRAAARGGGRAGDVRRLRDRARRAGDRRGRAGRGPARDQRGDGDRGGGAVRPRARARVARGGRGGGRGRDRRDR